jgi:Tol biopolymer transport system component
MFILTDLRGALGDGTDTIGAGHNAFDQLPTIIQFADETIPIAELFNDLTLPPPAAFSLVSANAAGEPGDGASFTTRSSSDGRFVVFASSSTNLVQGPQGDVANIFIKDMLTGDIAVVSSTADGSIGNGSSLEPNITADGRYVVFDTDASNLAPDDTNGLTDVYVKDLRTGTISRVSTDAAGNEGNGESAYAYISPDGRFVAFESTASNLVADDNNETRDVFVKDLLTGAIVLASSDSVGALGDGNSFEPSLSADGRFVAFDSSANNLVAGDGNDAGDIFVKDLLTGEVRIASTSATGEAGNGDSLIAKISPDGRYVAFTSSASNLVVGDTNGENDAFVKDLLTGAVYLLSESADGEQGNASSGRAYVSADGHFAVFDSSASNLVLGDTNGVSDVFVKDLQTGDIARISVNPAGEQGNDFSSRPSISADGRYIFFSSNASNLFAGDFNNATDAFRVINPLLTDPDAPVITSDGGGTAASLLVPEDHIAVTTVTATSPFPDETLTFSIAGGADANRFTINTLTGVLAFIDVPNFEAPQDADGDNLYDVKVQVADGNARVDTQALRIEVTDGPDSLAVPVTRVSQSPTGVLGNGSSTMPSISADGRFVAFSSHAANLVASDPNGHISDIFLFDTQTGGNTLLTAAGNNIAEFPSVSADGRLVAFASDASNLVAGDTNGNIADIFLYDTQTQQTTLLTPGGNQSSGVPKISADGRFVVFSSVASNLAVGDTTPTTTDIYLRDLQTGQTKLLTPGGNNASFHPSISGDGRFVVFDSFASNLVASDPNGMQGDVFLYDAQTQQTTLLTPGGNGRPESPVISANGRYVAFMSAASNLVAHPDPPDHAHHTWRQRQLLSDVDLGRWPLHHIFLPRLQPRCGRHQRQRFRHLRL